MNTLVRLMSLTILAVALVTIHATPVRADDSATTKIENGASDAKTSTKKGVRKAKRKMRKAAGTDTVGKDIKDSANDTKDNMENAKDKTENKLKN
jgi:hypothetical protein